MKVIEIIGVVLGIVGTILMSTNLASQKKYRLYIFIMYFFSNILMAIVMYNSKLYWALFMQVIFFLTSVNGIRNNWGKEL